MRIGVDASNITSGGGLTHLVAFLQDAFRRLEYSKIVVWCSPVTARALPTPPAHVEYRTPEALASGLVRRILWTTFSLHREARSDIDVLFVPGGLYLGPFRPFVTMCRNMLPFDAEQRALFGFSAEGLRLWLLRWVQALTFQRATRLVFLSRYAQKEVSGMVRLDPQRQSLIPHGIAEYFRGIAADYNGELRHEPPVLVYVSTFMPYKYQVELVGAAAVLRDSGTPVKLRLVGSGPAGYMAEVRRRIAEEGLDDLVELTGQIPHDRLPETYATADAILYASGCENFPNILVEAMATGLPVICSDKGPMPEILGGQAIYFSPDSPQAAADAIVQFLGLTPQQRCAMARSAQSLSSQYAWETSFSATYAELRAAVESVR